MAEAIMRKRHDLTRQGRNSEGLRCVVGRFQRHEFERQFRRSTYLTVATGPTEGSLRFMGAEVVFDNSTSWRFDFV
ncbi:hypothetical protein OKA04_12395 [Luteolibacter flavescens]|uniref:Uncharacterized protein n=1 Tax=Luteolibacter flavescens TaxID=1859460 RepID=A0ABT3FQM1_9BACT|nr:hypothetical protein [Luteolibacter flavescens]